MQTIQRVVKKFNWKFVNQITCFSREPNQPNQNQENTNIKQTKITHLIMPYKRTNLAERSIKYFLAILNGVWIVNFEWINMCLKNNAKADETQYQIQGDPYYYGGSIRSRLLISSRLLFKNLFVFVHDDYYSEAYPASHILEKFVIHGGGKVIHKNLHTQEFRLIYNQDLLDHFSDEGNDKSLMEIDSSKQEQAQKLLDDFGIVDNHQIYCEKLKKTLIVFTSCGCRKKKSLQAFNYYLSSLQNESQEQEDTKTIYRFANISPKWLLDSISNFGLISIDDYLIRTN